MGHSPLQSIHMTEKDSIKVVDKVNDMQTLSNSVRKGGRIISFVPTMGALHEGHISLIRKAKEKGEFLIVSIFVNPTQFSPGEDYRTYPRNIKKDAQKCRKEKVDFIFYPGAKKIYPENHLAYVEVAKLSKILEGKFRPTHFKGVTTIVLKLFNIIMPDKAYFGLKDYQQYIIIKKMVENLNLCVILLGMPLVRKKDGLAMSSRNKYLNKKEREDALLLSKALFHAKDLIKKGEKRSKIIIKEIYKILVTGAFIKKKDIDYVSIIHPDTLDEMSYLNNHCVIALAVRIGRTRLIDNIII